ncbi:MAG: hypothetical protein KAG61_00175 [Bacteriovoracaceae bacterium]|nr:hypothetical protein [Bacteriovoracaceae bacterium]
MARTEGVAISTFSRPEDMFDHLDSFPASAVYYIDSCLADGEKGEYIALELSQKVIGNIYLATGYDKEKFEDLDYIKGVVGKDFPTTKGKK